jgi:hypothetical protein
MRIYKNCKEAMSEIKREVAEMGTEVRLKTYQDKNIEGNPDYYTKELLCYSYMIHEPKDKDSLLEGKTADELLWSKAEFQERIGKEKLNPGLAWPFRKWIWLPFIQKDGKFSYTYSERIGDQVDKVISMLKDNPNSRNAIISIWDRQIDQDRIGGKQRVPCSMFFQLLIRNGKLNMIYNIRSNDVMTHWCFDIWMAISLQEYIAEKLGLEIGNFYQTIGSLHAYNKDLKGIF